MREQKKIIVKLSMLSILYIKMFKNRRRADGQHEKILKTKGKKDSRQERIIYHAARVICTIDSLLT